ncbi:polysaccharide biosynthesis protein [Shivajiella indica]|uniref:Polysaccharide biosynthesis protein n=1 Tax=Shivajiella indica TaxID=872115 RepID=A0ABW5BAZ5_9BACT
MVDSIFQKIWSNSPYVKEENAYKQLVDLTQDLIKLYDQQGRLSENPFEPSRKRTLSLPLEEIKGELENKICLVTGGLGYVGRTLIGDLLKFNVSKIFIVDIKSPSQQIQALFGEKVQYIQCDIRDEKFIADCIKNCQPEIVFHTAAIRDPGYAENHIIETVQTNAIGTWNLVNACENTPSVKKLVFSSTGKASRYLTDEIYASTKKICENIFDTFSQIGRINYGMVRFTHIYDNSLMDLELSNTAETGDYVRIHSPGKFVTAQNLSEASYLMLNALVYMEPKQCNFLLVRYLEWPVESLEVALYYIKKSGRKIPIVFSGNPKGYKEKFFRGQLDWNKPSELNLLINVYENQKRKINKAGDIIISSIIPGKKDTLFELIKDLKNNEDPNKLKEILYTGSKKLLEESLKIVNPKDTVNILKWGISPKFLEAEKTTIDDYGHVVPILVNSLKDSEYIKEIQSLLPQQKEFVEIKK